MTTLLTGRLQASSRELFIQLEVTVHPVMQLESVGSCRVASTWTHSESSGTHASTGTHSEPSGTQHFASTWISMTSFSLRHQPESAVSCRVASTGTHSEPSGTHASTGSRSESPGTQHFASTGISKSSHSVGLQPVNHTIRLRTLCPTRSWFDQTPCSAFIF